MALFGPLARLLRERDADEAMRDRARRRARRSSGPYATADGVRLPAAAHLVTATAPA